MVDVQATNIKLRARARRIVAQAAESATRRISEEEAGVLLERCNGKVRTAIVSITHDHLGPRQPLPLGLAAHATRLPAATLPFKTAFASV